MQTFDDGLFLPESPRWHDGNLWISDILHRTVFRYDAYGRKHTVAVFDDDTSGLGWTPSGELLVATMRHRKLVRVDDKGICEVADLSSVEPFLLNDMVVAADGTAFITCFGFDPWSGGELRTVEVIRVRPGGSVDLIGGPLVVPNGIALSEDERVLFVAESGGGKIVAIDDPLADTPAPARVFGVIPPSQTSELVLAAPDGMCLDREGSIWVADPMGHQVVQLDRTGAVADILPYAADTHPLAVALGGEERTTLFIAVAANTDINAPRINPGGRIEYMTVTVPGI